MPLLWGDLSPHLTHSPLGPREFKCQAPSRSSQPSFRRRRLCPCTLLWDGPFLTPKLPLPLGGSGHPSNTWLLGPTRAHMPNDISVSPAVFAGYLRVMDTQTHTPHYTSVAQAASVCYAYTMWPKNIGLLTLWHSKHRNHIHRHA